MRKQTLVILFVGLLAAICFLLFRDRVAREPGEFVEPRAADRSGESADPPVPAAPGGAPGNTRGIAPVTEFDRAVASANAADYAEAKRLLHRLFSPAKRDDNDDRSLAEFVVALRKEVPLAE